jgi:hypothetical protein
MEFNGKEEFSCCCILIPWLGILPVLLACAIPRNGREGAGWRLWNIGTWNTLSPHAELAAGLGARILAFRLHTPRYMCNTPAVIFSLHMASHRFHDIFASNFLLS